MPVTEDTVSIICDALSAIVDPRFYETERGYQGELLAELRNRLHEIPGLDGCAVVEQEYQKRSGEHGLTIRPDILIHCPFDEALHSDRTAGNFVAFELKLRAGPSASAEDYKNLVLLMGTLRYQLGVFVNISSKETHISKATKPKHGRLIGLATSLVDGNVTLIREDACSLHCGIQFK